MQISRGVYPALDAGLEMTFKGTFFWDTTLAKTKEKQTWMILQIGNKKRLS